MSQCYVCLEGCQTKSPCQCQMPVHEKCLVMAHEKMPRDDCSICRSPIRVDYVQLKPTPPTVYLREIKHDGNMCCCFVICIFCIYLILGWIGKLFLFIIGYETDALPFWTWEHIVCFGVMLLLGACFSNLFTPCRR